MVMAMMAGMGNAVAGDMQIGEHWDTECNSRGICKMTLYSYQNYYNNGTEMVFLNESFDTENCNGYSFCVDKNLWQFGVNQGDLSPNIKVYDGDFNIGFKSFGNSLGYQKNLVIEDNVATYKDIMPNVSLQYVYLPHMIKETLIVGDKSVLDTLPQFSRGVTLRFTLDDNYQYSKQNGKIAISNGNKTISQIRHVTIFDANDNFIGAFEFNIIDLIISKDIGVTIPRSNFTGQDIQYPLYIDPTIETNMSINADVYVRHEYTVLPVQYNRYDTDVLWIGLRVRGISDRSISMTGIDWDIYPIPDCFETIDLNLTLSLKSLGENPNNTRIAVVHMDGNSTDYPNINSSSPCGGNCNYFIDMSNGTNYTITSYTSAGKHFFNLTNATQWFDLRKKNDSFSVGMYAPDGVDVLGNILLLQRIYHSSTATSDDDRPKLYVTYKTDYWKPSIFIGLIGIVGLTWGTALVLDRRHNPLRGILWLYGSLVLLGIPVVAIQTIPYIRNEDGIIVPATMEAGRILNISSAVYTGMLWVFLLIMFYMFVNHIVVKPINAIKKR